MGNGYYYRMNYGMIHVINYTLVFLTNSPMFSRDHRILAFKTHIAITAAVKISSKMGGYKKQIFSLKTPLVDSALYLFLSSKIHDSLVIYETMASAVGHLSNA